MTCYVCDEPATTVEHVPPKSFFPKTLRKDLITVPSCKAHNNGNSRDVEYVRNANAIFLENNEVANEVIKSVGGSFLRSPKLFFRTFQDRFRIGHAVAYHFDLPRFEKVMKAIADGLYLWEFSKRHVGDWVVFSSSLRTMELVKNGTDAWNPLREMLSAAPMSAYKGANPEAFCYASFIEPEGGLLFRFKFFDAFVVDVWDLSARPIT